MNQPKRIYIAHGGQSAVDTITECGDVHLSLPSLGKEHLELLPLIDPISRQEGELEIWEDSNLSFGVRRLKIESVTDISDYEAIYREIFEASKGTYIYRIWNYLPRINHGLGDEENYKKFCEGRSNAFNAVYGEVDVTYMPAGTCVGSDGDELVIYFLAGKQSPDHHENPNQVPAYRYPRQYGPRSPSFARATTVQCGGTHYRFISGTAAVIGHESKGTENLLEQLELTCSNLDRIIQETTDSNAALPKLEGSGKVYLRHATDYEVARKFLVTRYPKIADDLIYLRSDICRKELLVEIELTLIS